MAWSHDSRGTASGERGVSGKWEQTAAVAALACRAAFDDRASPLLAAHPPADGEALLAYARRHRIQGLVWDSLAGLPGLIEEAPAAALAEDARGVNARNLATAAALGQLQAAFGSAGVDVLHLKGLALASLCYRHPMAKAGWDIDVLVASPTLREAAVALGGLRYRCLLPPDARGLDRWHRRRIESVWIRPGDEMAVELHTRLSPSPALIPDIGMASPRQEASVAGRRLETLADAPLLAYLAVHGANSLWFRLKWLADFAAFADRLGERLDAVAGEAAGLKVGRCLRLAFRLSARVFGTAIPPSCADMPDTVDRWLFGAALDQLVGKNAMIEPTGERLGTMPIHAAGLLLGGTTGFLVKDAARRGRDALLDRLG